MFCIFRVFYPRKKWANASASGEKDESTGDSNGAGIGSVLHAVALASDGDDMAL